MLPVIVVILVMLLFIQVTDFFLRFKTVIDGLKTQRVVRAYFEERLSEWPDDDDIG